MTIKLIEKIIIYVFISTFCTTLELETFLRIYRLLELGREDRGCLCVSLRCWRGCLECLLWLSLFGMHLLVLCSGWSKCSECSGYSLAWQVVSPHPSRPSKAVFLAIYIPTWCFRNFGPTFCSKLSKPKSISIFIRCYWQGSCKVDLLYPTKNELLWAIL